MFQPMFPAQVSEYQRQGLVKRVNLEIYRSSSIVVITLQTTFRTSNGGPCDVTSLPIDEYQRPRAGESAQKAIEKFMQLEGCTRVQIDTRNEIRVYPTPAFNDGEFKDFLRQAVAIFAAVYGPIDEFVMTNNGARKLMDLSSDNAVPSTDGDRIFVRSRD